MDIDMTQFNRYELNEVNEENINTANGDENPAPPRPVKIIVEHKAYVPNSFNIDKFKQDYIIFFKIILEFKTKFLSKK